MNVSVTRFDRILTAEVEMKRPKQMALGTPESKAEVTQLGLTIPYSTP